MEDLVKTPSPKNINLDPSLVDDLLLKPSRFDRPDRTFSDATTFVSSANQSRRPTSDDRHFIPEEDYEQYQISPVSEKFSDRSHSPIAEGESVPRTVELGVPQINVSTHDYAKEKSASVELRLTESQMRKQHVQMIERYERLTLVLYAVMKQQSISFDEVQQIAAPYLAATSRLKEQIGGPSRLNGSRDSQEDGQEQLITGETLSRFAMAIVEMPGRVGSWEPLPSATNELMTGEDAKLLRELLETLDL